MTIPKVSEATIRSNSNVKSFERGEAYYRSDAVATLTRRGNRLISEVEGSEAQPYRVTLGFDGGGFTSFDCTCAYNFDGWCKHIVATMLVCLHQPETIEDRPTLEQLLDRLDGVQTQRLIQELVAENPELIEAIERHITIITAKAAPKPPAKTPRRTNVDPNPFKRQVRYILREAVRYLEYGDEDDPITENISELIEQAQAFTAEGDGNNAIAILQAISEACGADWDDVAEYGADSDAIAQELNAAWTEAILSAELTPEQIAELQTNLETWEQELNADFGMSIEALRQGWEYPPLQRVLEGNITKLGAWDRQAPDYADDLAIIRLQILDRQERYQEYVYLAEAEGRVEQYLLMLVRLGRSEEAIVAAKSKITLMKEAFVFAQILRQQGALTQALEIVQKGLNLPGINQYEVAIWTSELAEGLGDRDAALNARTIAFKNQPNFRDYRKLEDLAAENWASLKTDLLANLNSHQGWRIEQAKVDIFLYEKQIELAIATVSGLSSYNWELIQRVMDAAIQSHPDWVIENASVHAESIMNQAKADAYDRAVGWLKKVRAAYLQADRRDDWLTYRAKIMQTHARKYKLIGLLKHRDLE